MPQRPDFIQATSVESAVNSSSEAQFYNSLADRLQRFSAGMYQQAERTVNVKGEERGLKQALAGNKTLQQGSSVEAQAYNRGALRVYTAETTTDILRAMPEMEANAYKDPGDGLNYTQRYDANVKGYREGIIKNMPAQVAPEMQEFLDRQIIAGRDRVVAKQYEEQQAFDAATTTQALDDLLNTGTQALVNGDDAIAEQAGNVFEDMLIGAVQDGIYTPAEAVKMSTAYQYRFQESKSIGEFDKAYDNGQGLQYIRNFADTVPAGMSAEDHDKIWGKLETRLKRREKDLDIASSTEAADRKERWREGKVNAAVAIMRGEEVDLIRLVEQDMIDPTFALQQEQRAAQRGPAFDDENTKAFYELNLLDYSEEEILEDQDLTTETRATLVESRRTLVEDQENWVSSKQGKEAVRRIRTAVGIVEGMPVPGMSNTMLREANEAQTELYNEVEALPPEERAAASLKIADKITARVDAKRAADDIPAMQTQVDNAEEALRKAKPDTETYRALDNRLKQKQKELDKLIKRAGSGR